jgi:hypothetical protein
MEGTMSTITTTNTESRILREGFGEGAWHGPDLKAAIADVSSGDAFWRPSPARHNIAEIAVHHAYYVRSVRGKLTGTTPGPFELEGDDWFALSESGPLSWNRVQQIVTEEHRRLEEVVADLEAARAKSPLSSDERLDVILGITCHAVYHAGQIQLLKRLR